MNPTASAGAPLPRQGHMTAPTLIAALPSEYAAAPHKSAVRKHLRACRKNLSKSFRRHAALQIQRGMINTGFVLRAKRFGLFIPHGAEIDTLPLIARLLAMGKEVYLPSVPNNRYTLRLWFSRLDANSRWVSNHFGVPEIHLSHVVRAPALDVLCMPLVGYDLHGYRLGMGGGYYDASLAYLRHRHSWRRPKLLGLAFSCQRLDEPLSRDAWDVPLDAVLTEQGLERF